MTITPEKQSKKRFGCLKIGLYVALALVILLGVAGYVLLAVSPVPEVSNYELELAQIRQLALAGEGTLPVRLNALIVAEGGYPKAMVVAGSGFQEQRMVFPSFQVVYEQEMMVIDVIHTPAKHADFFPDKPYFADKFDMMQTALRQSSSILATHEHFDHVGGISDSPYFDEISPKVHLTSAQFKNAVSLANFAPALLTKLTPFDYDQYDRVAPGVVLIKAPGHTPGSQMVYIQLQNGAEYLLVGGVVWNEESINRLAGRPLLTNLVMGEDRASLGNEIRALYNIAQNEPVHLIISHDGEQFERYFKQGLLGSNFE